MATHNIEKGLKEVVNEKQKRSDSSPHLYSLRFPRIGRRKNFNCIKTRKSKRTFLF